MVKQLNRETVKTEHLLINIYFLKKIDFPFIGFRES